MAGNGGGRCGNIGLRGDGVIDGNERKRRQGQDKRKGKGGEAAHGLHGISVDLVGKRDAGTLATRPSTVRKLRRISRSAARTALAGRERGSSCRRSQG